MNKLLYILALLMVLPSTSFSHDLAWGDPLPDGIEILEKHGMYTFCRGGENLFLAFCNGRLCEILGRIKGAAAFQRALDNCISAYGLPNYSKNSTWIWYNQAEVDILLFYHEQDDIGYYIYRYTPIFVELQKEKMKEREAQRKNLQLQKPKRRGK